VERAQAGRTGSVQHFPLVGGSRPFNQIEVMVSEKAKVSTTKVPIGEYEFLVNESGDPEAPTVLFLHGSGPGATGDSNWKNVIEDLGREYHCLAPDIIGFGDSTHPDPPPQGIVPFTQVRVDTLLGLLDKFGVEKANLVGNSMGGLISLHLVRQAPERVQSIVLMGAGGHPLPPGPALPSLIGFYADPSTEAMVALLKAMVYAPDMFGDELENIAALRVPRATRADVQRSHVATFDLSIPWEISDEELAAIAQDVLVIHGREDAMVPFAAGVWFFERIPNARLYGIGKCGHWTQIEEHDRFCAVLRGFLEGQL
jgi:2-hydroxymuconate-semialdehyde hydrolase